ncbi:hypothetical protein D9758_009648 [Tetrapyrgos nigripes]|uniref:histidinol-phosphate transaminase n=1 Tax=Tetrapyrgos nigripes TaxID=182062 RepID=A0A8H5FQL2_9AGAR|nr:hypothetical protein D9758_009648 [Tetrapyrgos nigripes]
MPIHGLSSSLTSSSPPHFDIEKVVRPNILALHPYRCARDDYKEGILLDANENALGPSITTSKSEESASTPSNDDKAINDLNALNLHRYPDPTHDPVKERIASIRGLSGVDHIFLGVGSDEVIDLLMRVCVTPAKEKILITPPTYGMYTVCAQVNDLGVVKVPLQLSDEKGEGGTEGRFSLQVDEIKKAIDTDPSIKLIFICSPGNPTGTYIPLSSVKALLDYEPFKGIVIVDEAYIDFVLLSTSESESDKPSTVSLVKDYANLCVVQTFSKSFGLAAIRVGVAIAQPPLIQVLTNTKAPYNISTPTAHLAFSALSPSSLTSMRKNIQTLVSNRSSLLQALARLAPLGVGSAIGGNDANFVVIPILSKGDGRKPDNTRSQKVYKALAEENKVVVRYRGGEPGCEGCLRITVGTEEENRVVVESLEAVLKVL